MSVVSNLEVRFIEGDRYERLGGSIQRQSRRDGEYSSVIIVVGSLALMLLVRATHDGEDVS